MICKKSLLFFQKVLALFIHFIYNEFRFKDGFPSGQRGQTVNLLATLSKVRILLHPLLLKAQTVSELLLFTHHYPAKCFGVNMPKSRDIQAKIPLPQAIWNEFWLSY